MSKTLQENLVSAGVDKAVVFTDYIRDKNRSIDGSTLKMTQESINAEVQNSLSNVYTKSQTYTRTEIDNKISTISSMSFEVVDSLPVTGDASKIYLLKKTTEIDIFKYFPASNYDPSLFINTLDKISDVAFDGNKEYVFKIDVRNGFEYNISTRSFVAINQNSERFVTTLTGFWENVGTTDISYDSENLTSPEENIISYSDYQTLGYIYLWWKASANYKTMYHIYRNYEDIYDEYIWITSTSTYEKIGSTSVDLSAYAKTTDIPTATSQLTNDSDFVTDNDYNHTDNNFSDDYKAAIDILAYTFSTSISPTGNIVYPDAPAATITATMSKTSKVTGEKVTIATPTINGVTPTSSNNTYSSSFSNVTSSTTYTFKEGTRTVGTAAYTRSIVEHILYGTTTSTTASTSMLSGATSYSGTATNTSKNRAYTATGLSSTFYFFIAVPNSNSGLTDIALPSKVNIGSTYDALAASDLVDMTSGTTITYNNIKYKVYRSPALAADTTTKSYYIS